MASLGNNYSYMPTYLFIPALMNTLCISSLSKLLSMRLYIHLLRTLKLFLLLNTVGLKSLRLSDFQIFVR